ncbi:hypothetical protein F2Q69_00023412 [Brassica cretica]|uniref:Uncharacterized protein n=1 Tax=Brassica cretica TaxID=69181 RepID=A0A8S9Q073_BRACR|nr:hypothetical protein F2Q69_00023412 [Brassica cretica]
MIDPTRPFGELDDGCFAVRGPLSEISSSDDLIHQITPCFGISSLFILHSLQSDVLMASEKLNPRRLWLGFSVCPLLSLSSNDVSDL